MAIADAVDGLGLTRAAEGHGLGSQAQAELLWSATIRFLGERERLRQGAKWDSWRHC